MQCVTSPLQGNNLKLGFPTVLPDAACGYGPITAAELPGLKLAGVSANSIFKVSPMRGCGACLEVKCTDKTVSVTRIVWCGTTNSTC
jgi:hypothetical protein